MTGDGITTPQEAEQAAGSDSFRLPSPSIFDGLDAEARAALEGEVEWFSLPGGQVLFAEGEPPDALYLLLSGALALIAGKPASMIAQIRAGETVGEMGVLSNRPRTATAVALRDSSLLRIDKAVFEKLIRVYPEATMRLLTQLVDWLDHTTRGTSRLFVPKTLALMPLDREVPTEDIAARLAASLVTIGVKVQVLDETAARHGEEYFHTIENAHDLIIYRGATDNTAWVSQCLRRADRLLFLTATGETPPPELPVRDAVPHTPWRVSELVLLHAESGARRPAAPWLARVPVQGHYHLRRGSAADIARLARCVTGRAVGLVLSGGGARGFGHIGVIKALREAGIPLDLLAGTSIGSIIAAGAALEWTDAEFETRMKRAFVDSNPLNDYAFPLVALTRGLKVSARLREHFGEIPIEDLWRPFFCVAANLTTGREAVLRQGVLWRALRASIAIPGLMPPTIENGAVLSDGAVLNNLPADHMATVRRGPVIGVDVTDYRPLMQKDTGRRRWLRRLLAGRDSDGPGIMTMLMAAANLSGNAQTRLSRAHVDIVLEPGLRTVSIRDWHAYDQAVAAGYQHTMSRMADIERALTRS